MTKAWERLPPCLIYGEIFIQLNLGWAWFPFGKEGAMEIVDAITIMILSGTFIIALLTYIAINYKRK